MNHLTIELFNHLTQFNHLKKELRKIHSFIQNKPNFPNAKILVNCVLTMVYVNIRLRSRYGGVGTAKNVS